ncbi:NAD-dependent protein deacylase [Sediminibacillus albus]|uniref:protein acetyllysine N-acetyltransferase n=1 Tax=Sediminibacillus albus TaxID=407036 RepID=A0A1G8ZXV9_9BACI|nr:NAD-dependent protein deacylase [Sediminibacillus albus]SDK19175.1 NAD-dependent protein deacetylase, SIR2 family [Sediminibacillus albus]
MDNQLRSLANQMKQADSITVLTGAGVSTASGIPDFRSATGIWTEDHSREYYMSRDYFHDNPEDFWLKYKQIFRLKLLKNYVPNHVHLFLRELEQEAGKRISIVTQNVDGLHSMAGNRHVIEYHGNLNTAACLTCGRKYDLEYVMNQEIPRCLERGCGDVLKPDIVLFGDPITQHEEAEAAVEKADFLLVLGTSLLVSPFNLLPLYARSYRIPSGLINRETTPMDEQFDYVVHKDLSKAVSELQI